MAVFGAMLSYIMQALSFIILRRNQPNIERPFRSPLGIPGAVLTIIIAAVTLVYQMQDPNFFKGVIWVVLWCAVGIVYFALVGRHKLILSPEEEFALEHKAKRASHTMSFRRRPESIGTSPGDRQTDPGLAGVTR